MFGTRRTGRIYTSVHLHPIKVVILGVTMLLVGFALAWGNTLWAIPIGIVLALLGGRLTYIGGRQALRGVWTFLS